MSDTGLPGVLDGFALTDQSAFRTGFPYDVFARLRHAAPVLWHPGVHTKDGEGFWVISRYADLVAAAELSTLSSKGGGGRAGGGTHIDDLEAGVHAGVLLNMLDDPRHRLLRDLVSPGLAKSVLDAQLPRIRAMAREFVDGAVAKGRVDLQPELTAPFAIQTMALLLGAPERDWPRLVDWAQTVAGLDNRDSGDHDDVATATIYALYEYSQELIALKRATEPTDDLMSIVSRQDLADHETEGPLSEYERAAFFCLVIAAGSEPARNAMAIGLHAMTQHPDQWARLRADRSLVNGAVEEMLRWSSPTPYNRRTATEDIVFRDVEIEAGQKVTLWWASGNRDESVFTDPDTFDSRRDPNPHLAFGHGIHSCLGPQLARLEMRVLLNELLDRVAEFTVVGDPEWAATNKHTVITQLPVELTPARELTEELA
ncbi:cytochrome P450 [Actinophytocola sediminis]